MSLEAVLKFSVGLDYKRVDYNHPIPISKQMIYFSYNDIREYNQSSYKRTYLSEKHDLDTNGYLDWVVKRVEEWGMYMWYLVFCNLFVGNIFPEKFGAENNFSVNITLQNQNIGGIYSAYVTEDNPDLMAHSWRKETKYFMVLDMFYDPHD